MYIKKLKEFISNQLEDYSNQHYISQHNDMLLNKFWPAFILLTKFYFLIGLIYVIAKNSINAESFNSQATTSYLYLQIGVTPLFIYIVDRVKPKLSVQFQLNLILAAFIIVETSFQVLLTEIYLDALSENKILSICQMFINLLLILGVVRTIKLRIALLLKFYLYFVARKIWFLFISFETLNIIFFICLILYFWDHQLITLSKVSQFAEQTLKSIPSAVCVFDSSCTQLLFCNNTTSKIITKINFGGNTATKSNAQQYQFPSQESILNSPINEITGFFENLFISQEEFKQLIENSSEKQIEYQESPDNLLNVNQIIRQITKMENQTQGQIYCLRCHYSESTDEGKEYPIMIEVRIKTRVQYGQHKNAILLNFYDISKNLRSTYYKNLNQFKSQVIRSISHELRTRLNVIQGLVQVIQYNSDTFDKETNKLLRAIFNNCRIQDLIISSIINYNLIREKKLVTKIEKCRLSSKVKEVVDLFQEEAELKNIKITFENEVNSPYFEILDYEKFQSILIHLISNSLKFNKKNGHVQIKICKDQSDSAAMKNQREREKKNYVSSLASNNNLKSVLDVSESSYHFPLRRISNLRGCQNSQFSNYLYFQTNSTYYEYYLIQISDDGLGINEEKLKQIKKLFQNEGEFMCDDFDSSSGMMLGLRASNSLIRYLGGKEDDSSYIQIESPNGFGTIASIHIKCRVTQSMDGVQSSDLQNKEQQSQIEVEGKIAEFKDFTSKNNFWTEPDQITSKTNIQQKGRNSIKNSNLINTSSGLTLNKKSSIMFLQNNNSSFSKQNVGNRNFLMNACGCNDKIVIVDDEPYNLLVLESMLKKLGYQCLKADNGQQCVTLIEKSIIQFEEHKCRGFKAIIMDYQMPIMNGEEATRQLQLLFKEHFQFQIPIFGLTGFSGEDELLNLLEAGMKEVFIKPISLKTLEEIVNNISSVDYKEYTSHLSSKQFPCIELEYVDNCEDFV